MNDPNHPPVDPAEVPSDAESPTVQHPVAGAPDTAQQAVPQEPGSQQPDVAAASHGPGSAEQQPQPTAATAPFPAGNPALAYAPAEARAGGFRRFAGHRATQLVAVGVLGALLGGGVVGTIAAVSHPAGFTRPALARHQGGPGGPRGDGGGFRNPGRGQGPNGRIGTGSYNT